MKASRIAQFALGPIVAASVGAVATPLISWHYDVADVGRLNILQTTTNLAVVLLFLGLDQAYVREYHESQSKAQVFATSMALPVLLLVILAGAVAFVPMGVASFLYGVDDPALAWGTMAAIGTAVGVRALSLVVRMQERGLAFAASQSVPKITLVAAVLLLGPLLPTAFGSLLGFTIAASAVALLPLSITTWRVWSQASWRRVNKPMLRTMLRYSVPLCLASFASVSLSSAGSFTLRGAASFTELGTYSVAVSVAGFAVVIQSIFSVVWAPILYRSVADGSHLELVNKVRDRGLAVVTLAFAAAGMFSWLLDFILPREYGDVKFLVIATVAQPLLYTMSEITSAGIGVTRRSSFALGATAIALAVGIATNLVLVPVLGASGAVIASAAAFWLLFVLKTEASARIWHRYRRSRLHALMLLAIALAIISVLLKNVGDILVPALWGGYGLISVIACWPAWRAMLRRGADTQSD
ncbi:lipopolysaccharide biosynthesis protein [Microbacterium paludicola]|uniref:lipopolysaccharide biosynthesis protein n=1 Tax=Microbacterium paludicola TaxID=300019 RepID=UPI003878FF56